MVDFHSHILPAMDDGAKDVTTALAMLTQAAEQGVDTVIATPHFYAGEDTPSQFFHRRQQSFEQLLPLLTAEHPQVRLGAEVLAWEGMSRMDLRPFCIEGTDLLLVEFPFSRMPYWLVEELENIILTQRLTVVLAHLDRYMLWYKEEHLAALLDLPDVVVQINAESLVNKKGFRRLRRWMPCPEQMVLGSDMHNLTDRAPCINDAVRTLTHSRSGRPWMMCIEQTEEDLLSW